MKVLVHTGLGHIELPVLGLRDSFNQLPKSPTAAQLNSLPLSFIINANGEVYISTDIPNYCDGENRVSRFI